jgi:trimeric autotransporter adhesin
VKFHLNRFLRRVRIHGGEFDTSARAMYRVSEKGSLMSYEKAFSTRADLRIVRGSTIERKQMSTKTTFKRIALVTVAALGFGVMSVAPSNAVINADSLTLSAATAAQNTAETQTATSAVATVSFLGASGDSMSVTASLVSGPAGNTALPYLSITETASARDGDGSTNLALGRKYEPNTPAVVRSVGTSAVTTVKYAVYVGTDSRTAPSVAGTYVVRLTPATVGGSGALVGSTAQTLTITVTAAPALDPVAVSATSIITTAADTRSATDVAVTAIKDASTTADRAVIKVSPLNAAGVAATDSYTAIIKSGPGLLGVVADANKNDLTQQNAVGRVVAVRSIDWVAVYSDGAAGVTTVEIQSKAGVVLATETLTFYGAATRMTAKALVPVIAASGSTDAILVNIYDGNIEIKDATTFYENSDKTSVIAGTYTVNTSVQYNTTEGGFVIPVTAVAAGTANITITTNSSASVTTGVTAAPVALRVGGTTLDDVKVAFDKASYLPGELATITVTPVDKDGLILSSTRVEDTYTVFATGGIVAPVALGTGSATITGTAAHDGGVLGAGLGKDGVASYKIYMPAYQGTFVFKYTTGTMATTAKSAVAREISVDVTSADGGAAAAAAEEATAAAQDATDAALSAAEAAEAATAMAQEAVDAVAELSASVTKLISALRAQITTLTNLVVKIQKKVRA